MKPFLVLYATKHGQTRLIAERMFSELQSRGRCASLCDLERVAHRPGYTPLLCNYSGAVLVGPLHAGQYPQSLCTFAHDHREELTAMNAGFASVSLTQTILQEKNRTSEERAQAEQGLAECVDAFIHATGWQPAHVVHFAGALMYTEYGIIERMLMKHIAQKAGASTDTTRNHELTDWNAVAQWAEQLCSGLRPLRSLRPREAITLIPKTALAAGHA